MNPKLFNNNLETQFFINKNMKRLYGGFESFRDMELAFTDWALFGMMCSMRIVPRHCT